MLHPRINESVSADLDVLHAIAAFFERYPRFKPLGPVAIVNDFRLRMEEQLGMVGWGFGEGKASVIPVHPPRSLYRPRPPT